MSGNHAPHNRRSADRTMRWAIVTRRPQGASAASLPSSPRHTEGTSADHLLLPSYSSSESLIFWFVWCSLILNSSVKEVPQVPALPPATLILCRLSEEEWRGVRGKSRCIGRVNLAWKMISWWCSLPGRVMRARERGIFERPFGAEEEVSEVKEWLDRGRVTAWTAGRGLTFLRDQSQNLHLHITTCFSINTNNIYSVSRHSGRNMYICDA